MAGAGKKTFAVNEVLSAADVNQYLMDQSVMRFADSTARSSAIPSPDEGMVSYLDDSNQVEVYDGSGWVNFTGDITQVTAGTALTGGGTEGNVTLNVDETELFTGGTAGYTALSNGTAGLSYQPVSHNYIINGAFDFWQRGTSFPSVSSDEYTADRWQYRGDRTTATVSQQAFSQGEIEATGFGDAEFFTRVDVDASGNFFSIQQNVEDVRALSGQTATLSFWAKADANATLNADMRQQFGSGGSSLVTIASQSYSVTTSWQRFSFTFSVPSISGKTIGTGSRLEVRPIIQVDATAYTLDLWGVQLEAGSIATPFKRNANSIQGELAACQRYYERQTYSDFFVVTVGQCTSSTSVTSSLNFRKKRATPSISLTGSSFSLYTATGLRQTSTSDAFGAIRDTSCRIISTVSSGLSAGNASVVTGRGSTIEIDAEL